MNCREIDKMTTAFIEDDLPVSDSKEFLRHISGCEACYHETETMFLMTKVSDLLKEDGREKDFNLRDSFRREVEKRTRLHRKITTWNLFTGIVVLSVIALLILFLVYKVI